MGIATKKILKNKLYFLILSIVLAAILIRPALLFYTKRESFFNREYHSLYSEFKNAYHTSQYVLKVDPGIIPDQTLETFAGGAFLSGMNPILIVHDQPPMGRYILSLSILIFDNVSTVFVILAALSALGVFLIGRLSLKNSILAMIPLGVFLNEPLFLNTLNNLPLLEPIQLSFIIFSLYFFILGIQSKSNYRKWFVLASIMLGFVISIRFFILGIFLLGTFLFYFLIDKKSRRKFPFFVLTLPLSVIILISSYFKTITSGYSIFHVFGIQKYIYMYHRSELGSPFSFWDLLFFNRWHTWWGDKAIASDIQWVILWPISALVSAGFFIAAFFKKIKMEEVDIIILIWVFMYSMLLSAGNVSVRYFMPLLPFLYILSTKFLLSISMKYKNFIKK